MLHIDASVYFANTAFVENFLRQSIMEEPEVRWVLLDLSAFNDVDVFAIDRLEGITEDYQERGIDFVFAGMKGPVRDRFVRAGWNENYGDRISAHSLKHDSGTIAPLAGGSA